MTDGIGPYGGSDNYIASEELSTAVNAAMVLERPLLVKGEPGTGKTLLAHSIAGSLGLPLFTWHVKSTTRAVDGLYEYDVVQRLNDSRFGDGDISDISAYIRLGVMGRAFAAEERVVVLIDEVDKADIEFPNDLLNELDQMKFHIPETNQTIAAKHRPVIIITSNAEKELPDAFLRRCVFHYIGFPNRELMKSIVAVHLPDLSETLLKAALDRFYGLRAIPDLRKPPSTSELLDWLLVLSRAGVPTDEIARRLPYPGILFKVEDDLEALERKDRRR